MPPVITLGGLLIATPRLAFAIAVLVGAALTRWLARHRGADERRRLERMGELLIVTMLLTARAGFAAQNWSAYRHAQWTVLYLWQSGYNVWTGGAGALLFVVVVAMAWPRRNTRQPLKLLTN